MKQEYTFSNRNGLWRTQKIAPGLRLCRTMVAWYFTVPTRATRLHVTFHTKKQPESYAVKIIDGSFFLQLRNQAWARETTYYEMLRALRTFLNNNNLTIAYATIEYEVD